MFRLIFLVLLSAAIAYEVHGQACADDEWQCNDGQCIQGSWRCDDHHLGPDCADGSDEEGCGDGIQEDDEGCSSTHDMVNMEEFYLDYGQEFGTPYRCDNGVCIPWFWRCDDFADCDDGSDEDGCDESSSVTSDESTDEVPPEESNSACTADNGKFECNDGECIPGDVQCDGKVDCDDGSDEDGCDGCDIEFDMTESSHTLDGVCFNDNIALADCLCACANDETCTAVDWNTSDTPYEGCQCWFHTQEITEENIKTNENVNQWQKKEKAVENALDEIAEAEEIIEEPTNEGDGIQEDDEGCSFYNYYVNYEGLYNQYDYEIGAEPPYRCRNDGECIPYFWRCDDYIDCDDGSDEDGCE